MCASARARLFSYRLPPRFGETEKGGNLSEIAEWVNARDPAAGHAPLKRYARRRNPYLTLCECGRERDVAGRSR